ncbi:hypothetical protein GKC30_01310 [Pseudodesulfovibrio sp. F-1]|uniref:Carboxypeptidase regulatory-like domain-containing protein n=1 Tax=Pseudodesulfovibrio alkaliphilus TaxID=2661613 RepID=A0A7K1KJM3_9BACT|nr:hypothetical protein [Pseudodesulfovibrio alkaliphilus]MUM76266.1 hypothetical protein [Pseudodesulfovibrio alkaliphilus]
MKKTMFCAGIAALLLFSTSVWAHTPLCDCFDNGDGTVTCQGSFSDGSSASGVTMRVLDAGGKIVVEGKMDKVSEFSFEKPQGDYTVQFDAGAGHTLDIGSSRIVH